MNAPQVAASLESFLRRRFRIRDDDANFTRSTGLWEEGYVDSIGVVELIAHLESTWGVAIPDEALLDPAFRSIDGIARIVSGLAAQRVA